MFIQGVAVPDTARVQQDGVDQIVVGWRPFPICFASMEKIGQVNGRDLFGGVQ